MTFAKLLPMAFVMIAGPQILSAIFLATTEDWKRNSIAYVAGASVSITAIVTLAYLLINGASGDSGPSNTIYGFILVLLVLAAIQTFRGREESEPPKWMGRLQNASPSFSFKLGFLLLGVFPTDILTSVAVGSYAGNHGDAWWHVLPFLGLTLFLLALPMILIFAFGNRAQAFLPKARDWMNNHSWIVSEIVIGLFILITLNSLV
jgi:Sap, sulfolipid-1-addressing protein